MNRRMRLLGLGAALLALAAGSFQVHRLGVRQRQELAALAAHHAALEQAATAQRRDSAALQSEIEAASRQLAALPAPADPAERTREREVQSWVARVKKLRQLFADRPQQGIPELRLLDDADWLRHARTLDHLEREQDIREALAAIRNQASAKFANHLTAAVQKYMRTTNGQKPETVMALLPYLEPPAELAMLQRWELAPAEGANRQGAPSWLVRQSAAIDSDYDTRYDVKSTNGISALAAPVAWIENYSARAATAYRRYADANGGAPPSSFAAVAPFFQPSLDPKTVDRIVQLERDLKRRPGF